MLLCSPEHAAAWAERQSGHGRAVDLTEAARLGGEAWASCAAALAYVSSGAAATLHDPRDTKDPA